MKTSDMSKECQRKESQSKFSCGSLRERESIGRPRARWRGRYRGRDGGRNCQDCEDWHSAVERRHRTKPKVAPKVITVITVLHKLGDENGIFYFLTHGRNAGALVARPLSPGLSYYYFVFGSSHPSESSLF